MANTAASFTSVDDDLYREIILDHFRNPRHKHAVEPADRTVEADNPLCGDEIDLSMRLHDGLIDDIGFLGRGCSISQASASMLCESVRGMSLPDARTLAERFRSMLQGADVDIDLGDLDALRGVRAYPVRVKCATLAWNALLQALLTDSSEAHLTVT
ncbi:MAG: SUF system NifU family Fe-S cluster assembly protein [Candidatus Dormibacteraeota bacterium]|nr:SUF system NifU family Fe-S cluster assembly protein [Candidatus Dormibacteraeota bacterium]